MRVQGCGFGVHGVVWAGRLKNNTTLHRFPDIVALTHALLATRAPGTCPTCFTTSSTGGLRSTSRGGVPPGRPHAGSRAGQGLAFQRAAFRRLLPPAQHANHSRACHCATGSLERPLINPPHPTPWRSLEPSPRPIPVRTRPFPQPLQVCARPGRPICQPRPPPVGRLLAPLLLV